MVEHDLGKLYERSIRLSHIVGQRNDLIKNVGIGRIKEGSSMDTTVRVGKLRERIGLSVDRLSAELADVNSRVEYRAKREARVFRRELKAMRKKMGEIASLADEGHIGKDTLRVHEKELRVFEARPKSEPWLKKALKNLDKEKQERNSRNQEKVVKESPSDLLAVTPIIEQKPRTSRNDPRPKQFDMPNGEKIGGKAGRTLFLASLHSLANPLTIEDLAKDLYKNSDELAITRTRAILNYSKKILKDSGFELLEVNAGALRGIYLQRISEVNSSQLVPAEKSDGKNLPAVPVRITVDIIDHVIRRKPRELMPYGVMGNEVAELRILVAQVQTGGLVIPGPKEFLEPMNTDKKLELAKTTLQGMIATTIASDIDKIGRFGQQVKLAKQITDLAYMLGETQGVDIINRALESLPTLQRVLLYNAMSINMKEKLDHPDLNECTENEMAFYLRHAVWPKLRSHYVRDWDEFEFEAKEEQVTKVEKILNAIDERAKESDFNVNEVIEAIGKSQYSDYLFLSIMKIAEIGEFLDLAERFFQEHSGTRNLAFLCARKLLEA